MLYVLFSRISPATIRLQPGLIELCSHFVGEGSSGDKGGEIQLFIGVWEVPSMG